MPLHWRRCNLGKVIICIEAHDNPTKELIGTEAGDKQPSSLPPTSYQLYKQRIQKVDDEVQLSGNVENGSSNEQGTANLTYSVHIMLH